MTQVCFSVQKSWLIKCELTVITFYIDWFFSPLHIQAFYIPSQGKVDDNFRIENMENCSYTKTIFIYD